MEIQKDTSIKDMPQALFDEWIAKLRSGMYPQTRGVLHDNKGFCCIGVLGDILAKRNEWEWKMAIHKGKACFSLNGNAIGAAVSTLPVAFRKGTGWKTDNPAVLRNGRPYTLVTLNDNYGLTFDEIADALVEERNS